MRNLYENKLRKIAFMQKGNQLDIVWIVLRKLFARFLWGGSSIFLSIWTGPTHIFVQLPPTPLYFEFNNDGEIGEPTPLYFEFNNDGEIWLNGEGWHPPFLRSYLFVLV